MKKNQIRSDLKIFLYVVFGIVIVLVLIFFLEDVFEMFGSSSNPIPLSDFLNKYIFFGKNIIKLNISELCKVSAISVGISSVALCNTVIGFLNSDKSKVGYSPFKLTSIVAGNGTIRFAQYTSVILALTILFANLFDLRRTTAASLIGSIIYVFILIFLWIHATSDKMAESAFIKSQKVICRNLVNIYNEIKKTWTQKLYNQETYNKFKRYIFDILADCVDLQNRNMIILLANVTYDNMITEILKCTSGITAIRVLFDYSYIFTYEMITAINLSKVDVEWFFKALENGNEKKNDSSVDEAQRAMCFGIIFAFLQYICEETGDDRLDEKVEEFVAYFLNSQKRNVCADIFVFAEIYTSDLNEKFISEILSDQVGIYYSDVATIIIEYLDIYIECAEELKLLNQISDMNIKERLSNLCEDMRNQNLFPESILMHSLRRYGNGN